MKILGMAIQERPKDRRVHAAPMSLSFDRVSYSTTDWGLGGFLVEDYQGNRQIDDLIVVAIRIDTGERIQEQVTVAKIVRVGRKGETLAANFVHLDADMVDLLESWLTGRLRRRARAALG